MTLTWSYGNNERSEVVVIWEVYLTCFWTQEEQNESASMIRGLDIGEGGAYLVGFLRVL